MCSTVNRPLLSSESEIVQIVSKLYGLHVKLVSELDSYYDRNYLVEALPTSQIHDLTVKSVRPISDQSDCYVFRVINAVDSRNPRKTDIQNEIIEFAKEAGYPVPLVLQNLEGSYQKLLSFENKACGVSETLLVRLSEFLPGTSLAKINLTKPLCRQIGHYAGRLDKILQKNQGYDESVLPTILNCEWNLSQISSLRTNLDVIEDTKKLELIKCIISSFEENVIKQEDKFSKGFIHGDLNGSNFIVSKSSKSTDDDTGNEGMQSNGLKQTYHICGVIDFGDLSYSYHLYEVAIAIAYVLINKDGIPPLQAACLVLSGFSKHIKLSDFELERLKICVCARFVQSFVMGFTALKANPDNMYTVSDLGRVWPMVEKLWPMSDSDFLHEMFQEIDEYLE